MKNVFTLLLCLFSMSALMAQIPNAGFESWAENEPIEWITTNVSPVQFYNVTQSTDAHSGTYAMRGEVLPLQSAGADVSPVASTDPNFPVSDAPSTVSGFYKYSPQGSGDFLLIACELYDANGSSTGVGEILIYEEALEYTSFSFPISYNNPTSNPSVSMNISMLIADGDDEADVGSFFLVDDLSLDFSTVVSEGKDQAILVGDLYPVPAVDQINLPLSGTGDVVYEASLYDQTGRLVKLYDREYLGTAVNNTTFELPNSISAGLYYLRLSTNDFSISKPFLVGEQ